MLLIFILLHRILSNDILNKEKSSIFSFDNEESEDILLVGKKLGISPEDIQTRVDAIKTIDEMHNLKSDDLAKMDLYMKFKEIEKVSYELIMKKKKENNILEYTIIKEWTELIMRKHYEFGERQLKPLLYSKTCNIAFCIVGLEYFIEMKERDCRMQQLQDSSSSDILEDLEKSFTKATILLQSGFTKQFEYQIDAIYTEFERSVFYEALLKHTESIPTFQYYKETRMLEMLIEEENKEKKDKNEDKINNVLNKKEKGTINFAHMDKLDISPELLHKLAHMNTLDISKTTIGLATFSRLRNVLTMRNIGFQNKNKKVDPNAYKHQYGINPENNEHGLIERRLKEATYDLNQNKVVFDIIKDKVPIHYNTILNEEEVQSQHEIYMTNNKEYNESYNFSKDGNKTVFDLILNRVFVKEEKKTPRGREYSGRGYLPPTKAHHQRYQVDDNTYFDFNKPNQEAKDNALREFNFNPYDRVDVSQEGINVVIGMVGENKDPDLVVKNASLLNFELSKKLTEMKKLNSKSSVVERLRHMYDTEKNHSWFRKLFTDSDWYWGLFKRGIMKDQLQREFITDSKLLNDIRNEIGDYRKGGAAKKEFNMYARQKILQDIQGLELSRIASSLAVAGVTIGVFGGLAVDAKNAIEETQANITEKAEKVIADMVSSPELSQVKEAVLAGKEEYDVEYAKWVRWKTWETVNWWQFKDTEIREYAWNTERFKDQLQHTHINDLRIPI